MITVRQPKKKKRERKKNNTGREESKENEKQNTWSDLFKFAIVMVISDNSQSKWFENLVRRTNSKGKEKDRFAPSAAVLLLYTYFAAIRNERRVLMLVFDSFSGLVNESSKSVS